MLDRTREGPTWAGPNVQRADKDCHLGQLLVIEGTWNKAKSKAAETEAEAGNAASARPDGHGAGRQAKQHS